MRHMIILIVVLIATSTTCPQRADAIESGTELANYCQSLERTTKGTGEHVHIPNTKQALLCWGYMQAMQDMSVLVTPQGRRLIGSCPPEQTTLLQLIRLFATYARSHPGEVRGNTAAAVIRVLQVTFPCHQISASAEQHSPLQRQRSVIRLRVEDWESPRRRSGNALETRVVGSKSRVCRGNASRTVPYCRNDRPGGGTL